MTVRANSGVICYNGGYQLCEGKEEHGAKSLDTTGTRNAVTETKENT